MVSNFRRVPRADINLQSAPPIVSFQGLINPAVNHVVKQRESSANPQRSITSCMYKREPDPDPNKLPTLMLRHPQKRIDFHSRVLKCRQNVCLQEQYLCCQSDASCCLYFLS